MTRRHGDTETRGPIRSPRLRVSASLRLLPPCPLKERTLNPAIRPQVSSLYSAEDIDQDVSYLIVAERTNTNGSRKFKRLLEADDWDGLVSMAKDEVRDGSHVLDVCVDFVGRDGARDMHELISRYVRQVSAPLMLDSTDPSVMEAGLKLAAGRCILNSMNLEDGEERIARICQLGPHVWRGGGGRHHRRGQAARHGAHGGAQAGDRAAHSLSGDGQVWPEERGPAVRSAGAADLDGDRRRPA